jgi:putative addiction module component (TIGR02574 family)
MNSQIEEDALHLPQEDRARLALRLLESLDEEFTTDADKLWANEVSRRAQEIDEGKVDLISAEKLEERVNARLK